MKWMVLDLRSARVAQGLVLSCLACHLIYLVLVALVARRDFEGSFAEALQTDPFGWFATFGLSREGLRSGWLWQLVSHAFLHGSGFHLLVNALLLLTIGSRVERIGSPRTVLQVFLAGVLAGGILQMLTSAPGRVDEILVGASGGCMALLLWLTTVSPESRMWPVPVSARNLGLGILVTSGVLAALPWLLRILFQWRLLPAALEEGLVGWLTGSGLMQIAHGCHLGGALIGWVMARRLLRPRLTLEMLQRERARRETPGGP